jgi:hypothetical protein
MIIFEIDVSGEDLLQKDYTVCIANKDSIIKGFKFGDENAPKSATVSTATRVYPSELTDEFPSSWYVIPRASNNLNLSVFTSREIER